MKKLSLQKERDYLANLSGGFEEDSSEEAAKTTKINKGELKGFLNTLESWIERLGRLKIFMIENKGDVSKLKDAHVIFEKFKREPKMWNIKVNILEE